MLHAIERIVGQGGNRLIVDSKFYNSLLNNSWQLTYEITGEDNLMYCKISKRY